MQQSASRPIRLGGGGGGGGDGRRSGWELLGLICLLLDVDSPARAEVGGLICPMR